MRIRFIPKNTEKNDPIVRLRCDMIIEGLREKGLDVARWSNGEDADILVIASINLSEWVPLVESKRKGQKIVFDLSENEFRRMARIDLPKIKGVARYIYNPMEVFRRFIAHFRRKSFDSLLERMVRSSDHIVVSSEDICASVIPYNPNCTVIYEPLDKGFPKTPKFHVSGAHSVVWIGMPGNMGFVLQIKNALNKILESGEVQLKIITSPSLFDYFPGLRRGKPMAIEFIPWDLKTLWTELLASDIGIAPLFHQPWKSPNKVITYWAAGLPVIASPTTTYSRTISHGHDGFLAADSEDWRSCLMRLINEPDLRNRLGREGYRKATTFFSLEYISRQWLNLFETLAGRIGSNDKA